MSLILSDIYNYKKPWNLIQGFYSLIKIMVFLRLYSIMMGKILFFSIIIILVSCKGTEHTETITAEITAAQMEGRRAAREIILTEASDTSRLQQKLLEAKSKQSKYVLNNRADCAAAFDSAFISTIKAIRPDIVRNLKTPQN